jgi:predicted dehydrogenase
VVTALEQVEALESLLAADEGPPTQVGCVLRFLPAVRTLKSWLDGGRAGTVVRAAFECGQYLPDWRPKQDYRESYSADGARGGGVIFDLVHELDLALFLLGDLELLSAAAARRSHLELAAEDAAVILLRSASGIPVSVSLDYVSRCPVRRIDLVGDHATLRLDFIAKRLELMSADGMVEELAGFDTNEAYRAELAELLAAREQRGATSLPVKEGLRSTRLAIAARAMAGLPA